MMFAKVCWTAGTNGSKKFSSKEKMSIVILSNGNSIPRTSLNVS